MTALKDLISTFDTPLPDAQFPRLVECLGEEARKRVSAKNSAEFDAAYYYLLARTYELLGYCARHTPWLSHSPKFYWQAAFGFFERAGSAAPDDSPEQSFLRGKSLLRHALAATPESKATRAVETSLRRIKAAAAAFDEAADGESDHTLRLIYQDAGFIAKTEVQQRERVALLHARTDAAKMAPRDRWPDVMKQAIAVVDAPAPFSYLGVPSGHTWVAQYGLAKARDLNAEARLIEELLEPLQSPPKGVSDDFKNVIDEKLERILACYEESASLCAKAGLTVRAAHTNVTRLRIKADAELQKCIRLFKSSDAARRDPLPKGSIPDYVELAADVAPLLARVRPDERPQQISGNFENLLGALRARGFHVGSRTSSVFNDANGGWVVSDQVSRYHLIERNGKVHALDLTRRPIAFSPYEATLFYEFAAAIRNTCSLYTDAIRLVHQALREAKTLYATMTTRLETDKAAVNDPDLFTLHLTTDAILKELDSKHYPLLSTLRDRIRYAWSLLEMFQMRNGSVRLDTLFSAQCCLIMKNPCYDATLDEARDEVLEVGADPVFRMTFDFVFRGAKGEEDLHESQYGALKTSGITIKQERRSLLSETRWIYLEPRTRNELLERLECHRRLVEALVDFTPVFVVQRPKQMPTQEIQRRIATIDEHMNGALVSYRASREYRSKLIDERGLLGLQNYMRGIALVLLGMNEQASGELWAGTYHDALRSLDDAKEQLGDAGDVYLLPMSARDEYLKYVDARILTVRGWEARYRALDSHNAHDFEQSADFFERSAFVFRELGDYRVATKASARAKDVRSFMATGEERRRLLVDANALYAASGNDQGFEDTLARLEQEYPDDPRSVASRKVHEMASHAGTTKQTEKWIGRYQIIDRIGQGGMAVVYRVRRDGQNYALKTIRQQDVGSAPDALDELRKRFAREIVHVRSLEHPGIVRVVDADEYNDPPYLVMELLNGSSLDKKIEEKKPFAPRAAAQIAMQVTEALAYAHAKGVLHRDLKPANIMLLDDNGTMKILDFGIAQSALFPKMTVTGETVGTQAYMSRDRLGGVDATYLDDLYALGLIAYEMLTASDVEAFTKRRDPTYRHPTPGRVVANVPPELDHIIARLLQHGNPFASAGQVAADLRTFLAGLA